MPNVANKSVNTKEVLEELEKENKIVYVPMVRIKKKNATVLDKKGENYNIEEIGEELITIEEFIYRYR